MHAMKLLLVDDEERFLSTTEALLKRRGYDAMIAPDGVTALKLIEEHRVDVVILDIKMPGMDGLTVLKNIKAAHPLVEVLLLTGHGTVESAVQGLKLGAFNYLTKPASLDDLIGQAEEAYGKKKRAEEQRRKNRIDEIISHPMAVFEED